MNDLELQDKYFPHKTVTFSVTEDHIFIEIHDSITMKTAAVILSDVDSAIISEYLKWS